MPIRRAAALLLAIALLGGVGTQRAWAHAGLVAADPAPGATLDATPPTVRLAFSERPEPSLSEIRVLDSGGAAYQSGSPLATGADQHSLTIPVRPLGRGTYTVSWRVVSAEDGHATSGTYGFGVGVSPTGGAAVTTTTTTSDSSWLEGVARWILLVGLVVLLGAAVATVARFGGAGGSDLALAAGGWGASFVGVLLLAEAQRIAAGSSFSALFDTSVGRALIWRAVAVLAAGAALLLAWRLPALRRWAMLAAALAALAAVSVHVGAGHAAAGAWPSSLTILAQVAHFAAAGVWFGGLAALLLGVRGEPSAEKAASVRRFAVVAAATLVIVVVTGTVRAIDELTSVGELVTSGYGRAVLAKIALIAIIAGLAARNRRRVPAAAEDLGPLRRGARVELALAAVALAVAALLGSLAPPVGGQPQPAPGLSASGSDFGTSVRVDLATASQRPGPNRFLVEADDYDSGDPVGAQRISLRFTPLDDPGVEPSSLELHRLADGSFAGSGANLAFPGRWEVTALIERGSQVKAVPLELDVPGTKYFVSVQRIPGRPPKYTMQVGGIGYLRISPDPERPGPSEVEVTVYTAFENVSHVDEIVVTAAAGDGPTRQQPLRRLGSGRFVADIDLAAGPFTIAVVARTSDGTRLRGVFALEIPG